MKITTNGKRLTRSTNKTPTGIVGLDEITGGGWPRGRTTLIEGGAGSGKTILALQSLVNGATHFNEPGIFVAFEESSKRLSADAAKFGWDLPALQKRKLFFLDAQPNPDLIRSGGFDLDAMLAAVAAKADEIKAKRIAFDAVDIILTLMNDPQSERREMYRLHEWLLKREMTAIITCKCGADGNILPPLAFMQFMVDCAVSLKHEVVQGVSQRNLRVAKYRGSAFEENESPFIINGSGIDVASMWLTDRAWPRNLSRRISSGVKRLDGVLGGGYHVNSSVLITGVPGTAKTTLSGSFVEAACKRGERAMFVSFDTDSAQVVRNLSSVNIRLQRFLDSGLLLVVSARSVSASAEIHLMNIKSNARAHRARCVVVDPVSSLSKPGNALTAHGVSERLLDWAKSERITLLCTSLLDRVSNEREVMSVPISTIADTWIHLSYLIHAGERNRSLSIVKSRGTWHSNQVRELVLSAKGVTLADAYTAGGEVLMGTLRWEKERSEHAALSERDSAVKASKLKLAIEETALLGQLRSVQREIESKRSQIKALELSFLKNRKSDRLDRMRLLELRGEDLPVERNGN